MCTSTVMFKQTSKLKPDYALITFCLTVSELIIKHVCFNLFSPVITIFIHYYDGFNHLNAPHLPLPLSESVLDCLVAIRCI